MREGMRCGDNYENLKIDKWFAECYTLRENKKQEYGLKSRWILSR